MKYVREDLKARCQYDRWVWTKAITDNDSGSCTSQEPPAIPSFRRDIWSFLGCGLLSTETLNHESQCSLLLEPPPGLQ
jgi:hypothetical protein